MIATLAQLAPPPFQFTPMTWAAFVLANAIILGLLGRRLLRDIRGWFGPKKDQQN